MKFSKNVNNKRHAPRLIFFNEKKLRKIRIIFDLENWLWKSEIVIFRSLDLERRLIYMFILIKRLQEKVSKICDSKGQGAYKTVSQNQNKYGNFKSYSRYLVKKEFLPDSRFFGFCHRGEKYFLTCSDFLKICISTSETESKIQWKSVKLNFRTSYF